MPDQPQCESIVVGSSIRVSLPDMPRGWIYRCYLPAGHRSDHETTVTGFSGIYRWHSEFPANYPWLKRDG